MAVLPGPPPRRLRAAGPALSSTLITGGTVVTATGTLDADVLVVGREDRRRARPRRRRRWSTTSRHRGAVAPAAGRRWADWRGERGPGHRRHRASTCCPAASTCTRTWRCRSAARSPWTPSRPAPGPRRGAAPRRSSTSPSRPRAPRCSPRLDKWHEKADGNCAIDYGFHMIVSDVNDTTLQGDGRLHRRRGDQLQDVHGLPRRVLRDRRRDPAGHAAGRAHRAPRS